MLTTLRRFARRTLRVGDTIPHTPCRSGVVSQVCTLAQLDSPAFRHWLAEMKEPHLLHRKLWEWGYIAQALHERDMLRPGRRGLGFAVGDEPLASLFAARGCEVLATDLDPGVADPLAARWRDTGQHMAGYELLNRRGICTPEQMSRVGMRYVDMTAIPPDLTGFDFVWSSCSMEHLGTLERGMQFAENAVRCLKPGGVAVHTTEFNVSSNRRTIEAGPDVLYRRRDIEELTRRLERLGCDVAERDYFAGDTPADDRVDRPPYSLPHLKLAYGDFTITSFGFIVTRR